MVSTGRESPIKIAAFRLTFETLALYLINSNKYPGELRVLLIVEKIEMGKGFPGMKSTVHSGDRRQLELPRSFQLPPT